MAVQKSEILNPEILTAWMSFSEENLMLLNQQYQIVSISSPAKALLKLDEKFTGLFFHEVFPETGKDAFKELFQHSEITLKAFNLRLNLSLEYQAKKVQDSFLVKLSQVENPKYFNSGMSKESENEVKKQLELHKLLVSVSNSFINIAEKDFSKVVNKSLKQLGKFIGADRMYIFEYNREADECSNTYEWCAEGIEPQIEFLQNVPMEGLDDWKDRHLRGESLYIPNVGYLEEGSNLREILEPQGIQSLLAMPLMLGKECLGFIGLDSVNSAHVYNENEYTLLTVFSATLIQAQKRVEKEIQLKKRVKELDLISKLSDLVHLSEKPLEQLCQEIAELIPSGFVLPQQTKVQLSYAGKIYKNQGFVKTKNSIKSKLAIDSKYSCCLEVFIPDEKSFLKEEITLVETIGKTLKQHMLVKEQFSEIVKSKNRLDGLVNAQTSYVIRTDLFGNQNYFNKKYAADFGHLINLDESKGGNLLLSVCSYHRKKAFETVQKSIESPGKVFQIELDKPLANGEIATTLWDFICLANSEGMPSEIQAVGINISERISMEERLVESEERFRILSEHVGTVIWELDSKGKFTYVNQVAEKVWGYEPAELIGKKYFYDLAPAKLRDYYKDRGLNTIRTRKDLFGLEVLLEKKNGQKIWVNSYGTPLLNSAGKLIGYRGTDYDISEKKHAEEELRKFKMIVEKTSHGVILINAEDHSIQYVNEAFSNMLGYESNELIGNQSKLIESQFSKFISAGEQNDENSELTFKECVLSKKTGDSFPALLSANLLNQKKGMSSFYALQVIDLSFQKELEAQVNLKNERLEAITQAIPDLVFVSDDIGNYVEYYSSKVENTIGDYSHLLGKNVLDVFDEEVAKLHLENIQKCIQSQEIVSYEYHGPEGEENRVFECKNVFLSEDKVLRFVREITQRKLIEKELLELNENLEKRIEERMEELTTLNSELITARNEAERANKSKSEFLSRMSHELRTPMNSILGFSQILELSSLNSAQQKNLQFIMRSANHLLQLINEVLDLSKIEAGKMELDLEAFDISQVIREAVLMVKPLSESKSIQVDFYPENNTPAITKADLHKTRQIILNLVNNAIKYNYTGGSVQIYLRKKEKVVNSQESWLIEIKDSGFGIAQEDLDKLFKPFERVGLESKKMEGTGLGLSLVEQFVHLMGGNVGVESEVGKGSNFWVELPYSDESQKRAIDYSTPVQKDLLSSSKVFETVLLVEDNFTNIELIEEIMRQVYPNTSVVTTITGMEAFGLAQTHQPSLILLDMNLPDMDGKEVLSILKASPTTQNIPVVVVSADCNSTLKDEVLKAGAEQFILKPIEMTEMVTALKKYLK